MEESTSMGDQGERLTWNKGNAKSKTSDGRDLTILPRFRMIRNLSSIDVSHICRRGTGLQKNRGSAQQSPTPVMVKVSRHYRARTFDQTRRLSRACYRRRRAKTALPTDPQRDRLLFCRCRGRALKHRSRQMLPTAIHLKVPSLFALQ